MPKISLPRPAQAKFPKLGGAKTSMPLQSKRPKQSSMGKVSKKPAF